MARYMESGQSEFLLVMLTVKELVNGTLLVGYGLHLRPRWRHGTRPGP